MSLHLITPPARYPVTLEEVKAHLRVETGDEDATIDRLIASATSRLDGPTGALRRCLVQQTWEYWLDSWCDRIEIPLRPVVPGSVSIVYLDGSVEEQTMSPSLYGVIGTDPAFIQTLAYGTWPSVTSNRPDAIRIRFTVGYASVVNGGLNGTIPEPILKAMLGHISLAFDMRETPDADVPDIANDPSIMPYRQLWV